MLRTRCKRIRRFENDRCVARARETAEAGQEVRRKEVVERLWRKEIGRVKCAGFEIRPSEEVGLERLGRVL